MLRTERYNPQFEREYYVCLNGEWKFTAPGKISERTIQVPFCPESKLSGIGYRDFIKECEYTKVVKLEKPADGERLVLNFGAVDYEAKVYINGNFVGEHRGGYTPFGFDIAPFVVDGDNEIKVTVFDDVLANVPSGKQSDKLESYGCFYTRTTGIWQTVWLEKTPKDYIRNVKFYPDVDKCSIGIELDLIGNGTASVEVYYEGKLMAEGIVADARSRKRLDLKLKEKHLWEPGHGRLYDVVLKFGGDRVKSYFGLREVRYDGRKFLVNGKSVFQRFVLDQGYYPDGIYTAPDEESIKRDIDSGFKLGFNGARLHQKVFEPRFLYHCDKAGYMVWGEFPSWGVDYDTLEALGDVLGEWTSVIERDFNHPSIITWCPLNETWVSYKDTNRVRDARFVDAVYETTKCLDNTRPCVDVSGGFHGHKTDLYDFHCYYSPDKLGAYLDELIKKDKLSVDSLYAPECLEEKLFYGGEATNASEYGGIALRTSSVQDAQDWYKQNNEVTEEVTCTGAWGYATENSEEDFVNSYIRLTELLLSCPKLSGFCYTQLYDIEQEQNGFLTYGRMFKLSASAISKVAECNRKEAAIETETEIPTRENRSVAV